MVEVATEGLEEGTVDVGCSDSHSLHSLCPVRIGRTGNLRLRHRTVHPEASNDSTQGQWLSRKVSSSHGM